MVKLNRWRQMVKRNSYFISNLNVFLFLIDEQTNKRPASPNDKCEKIEYLIRDALDRTCPALVKRDGNISETKTIFIRIF
jgi:hypothetical protein